MRSRETHEDQKPETSNVQGYHLFLAKVVFSIEKENFETYLKIVKDDRYLRSNGEHIK